MLKLPPERLAELRYVWELWALPHQLPPNWEKYSTWLNYGGRGAGKNVGATQEIRRLICEEGVMRLNFGGRTAASVRDDMVRGEAGIIAAFPPHQRPQYISSQSAVRFFTGAEALLLTAEEPESFQGKNAEVTWLDEFSTYGNKTAEVHEQVILSTRVGVLPRTIITTNRLPDNEYLETLIAEAEERRIFLTKCSSWDNFANLPDDYQRQIELMAKTAYGLAWVTGERYRPEGALWKEDWFKRVDVAPSGGTTIVAVDPAGTEHGDETGIVVARRVNDRGYILEDLSGHHAAEEWPRIAVRAAHRHGGRIVIERNRGLDFLAALVRIHDRSVPIKEVHTDIRKDDRFFPIAALYELGFVTGQGKIFHVGGMPKLEKQMTTWDPSSQATQRVRRKATSPDRIDAAVLALTELRFHLGIARGMAPLSKTPKLPTLGI